MQRTSQYTEMSLEKGAKKQKAEDLKACLAALDRMDIKFVISCLGLPPPEKPKPNAQPQTQAAPRQSPQERKILQLEKQIEKKDQAIEQRDEFINFIYPLLTEEQLLSFF